MKIIKYYVDLIDDELESAKEYAEKYVECKARGNLPNANKYKEMSNDELKHATYLHDFAMKKIEEIEKVFKPTTEMEEKWNKSHKEYVEYTAWIKQMLSM